jgi:hypothetical protein
VRGFGWAGDQWSHESLGSVRRWIGRRAGRLSPVAFAVIIAASACSGSQTTPAGLPSPGESPTAAATAAPTPSPSPVPPSPTPTSPVPRRVSKSVVLGDVFANCTYKGIGTLTRGVTYEPSAAIGGPANPQLVAALYYQDYVKRQGMNGGLGFVLATSNDGGQTWANHPIPFGACVANRRLDAVANGRVAIGPDGTVYVVTAAGDGISEIRLILTASRDEGVTWTPPVSKVMPGWGCHADEPSITADPTRTGRAWAVWLDACWPKGTYLAISTTSDYGRTWTKQRDISLKGIGWVNWPSIVADPATGLLRVFFSVAQNGKATSYSIVTATSADAGATWSAPAVVATGPGQWGPDPSAALAPDGSLYVAWDATAGVTLAVSRDGGSSWGTPSLLYKSEDRASLAVDANGAIAVAFGQNTLMVSADGGRTFSEPQRFSNLPVPDGFAGDYRIATLAAGTDFHAIFQCMLEGETRTCFW